MYCSVQVFFFFFCSLSLMTYNFLPYTFSHSLLFAILCAFSPLNVYSILLLMYAIQLFYVILHVLFDVGGNEPCWDFRSRVEVLLEAFFLFFALGSAAVKRRGSFELNSSRREVRINYANFTSYQGATCFRVSFEKKNESGKWRLFDVSGDCVRTRKWL